MLTLAEWSLGPSCIKHLKISGNFLQSQTPCSIAYCALVIGGVGGGGGGGGRDTRP